MDFCSTILPTSYHVIGVHSSLINIDLLACVECRVSENGE